MSRRDSRTSGRQSDTLQEFENLKRKYLLANKHITKLNSQLHVRIEELNVQVSTLTAENVRLRATQLSLATRLTREKEKSRKVASEAEIAIETMMKQLQALRISFSPFSRPSSDSLSPSAAPTDPPPPRAQKPLRPSTTRLSRPPVFPEIDEVSEECSTPTRPPQTRPPPPLAWPSVPSIPSVSFQHVTEADLPSGKRRPTRRQSGLLTPMPILPPRPLSPTIGSPGNRVTVEIDSDGEMDNMDLDADCLEEHNFGPLVSKDQPPVFKWRDDKATEIERKRIPDPRESEREERERAEREKERQRERDLEKQRERELEMQKEREMERERERERDKKIKAKLDRERQKQQEKAAMHAKSLRDVTNSPPLRFTSPVPGIDGVSQPTSVTSSSSMTPSSSQNIMPTPSIYVPTAAEQLENEGRERRARKSINYAEPKLNTKMRKPDSATSTPGLKSRPGTVKRKKPPTSNTTSATNHSGAPRGSYPSGDEEDDGDEGFEADGESPRPRIPPTTSSLTGTKRRRASADAYGDYPHQLPSSAPTNMPNDEPIPMRRSPASIPLPPDSNDEFDVGLGMGFIEGRKKFGLHSTAIPGGAVRNKTPPDDGRISATTANGNYSIEAQGRRHSIAV